MTRWIWIQAPAAALLFSCLAWAQEDEPGRGVARISVISGDVSVRRGDNGDWIAAAVNTPLVAEDHVLTGVNSRTEIQFDYANMLRLGPNAEVRIADLENQRYQVQLARGTVTLSVLRDSNTDVEVDTPNVSVRPRKKGDYRITVRENGETEITVRSGEAEAFTPRGTERLRTGRTMIVRGPATDPEFQVTAEIPRDEWDRWNEQRDETLRRSRSYEYVSRDIYGADDLDRYGRWINVPPYGWVWSPAGVAAGWAPYGCGRWTWVDFYGWTWVDCAPWGWAPFHYGRWFWGAPYGWCWYPGPVYHRHFWRPALVAFFGFRVGGVHVGIGFGNVGWVPLAPYEPFYPWYGRRIYGGFRNRTYVDNSVRIVNNVNITNIYRNARVVNGISGIDADGFSRGRGGRAVRISDADFRNASLVRGALPVTPAAESLRVSDREVRLNNMRSSGPTTFYSRRQAPNIQRVPFEQQRQSMENVVNRTFGGPARGFAAESAAGERAPGADRSPIDRSGARTAAGAEAFRSDPSRQGGVDRSGSGWRRLGEQPSARAESAFTAPQAGQSGQDRSVNRRSDGWRRFGTAPGQAESPPGVSRTDSVRGDRNPGRGSSESWNRFGSGRAQPQGAAPSGGSVRDQQPSGGQIDRSRGRGSSENWNRFGASQSEAAPRTEPPRSETPSWRGRSDSFSRPQRMNLNPPIVRERPMPRMEQPRMERSVPRSEGMGGGSRSGGGSVRSGGESSRGGGGGGARSEGGGNRGGSRGGRSR